MVSRRKTALVVEDSPVQAIALQQLLEQQGLQVLRAVDGRVGVAMAERYSPDVIILDVQMPEMDGLEACRHLKQNSRTKHIPIMMLTSRSEPTMLTQGLDLGAIDFIPKDAFSDRVLVESLRQLHILNSMVMVGHEQE
jgi:two-component system phosphate regulon response regulator PhoB